MAMPSFPSTFASWWLNFTTPLIVLIYPIRIHGPSYFTHIVVCVTLSVAAVILAASPFLPMQLVIVMAVVVGTSTVFFPLIAVIASSACASGLVTYVVWTSVSQQYTYFHLGVGVVALLTAAATLASRRLFDNWQMLYCPIIGGYLIASAAGCQWLEEEEWAKNVRCSGARQCLLTVRDEALMTDLRLTRVVCRWKRVSDIGFGRRPILRPFTRHHRDSRLAWRGTEKRKPTGAKASCRLPCCMNIVEGVEAGLSQEARDRLCIEYFPTDLSSFLYHFDNYNFAESNSVES
ncbi:hypothetical protein FOZ62_004987 [Perkinsus olseni]|uniref:Uncharacterized protein n=1 Tax=Perkinsus olseni TaxID=32597 RepID=A0A7J6R862_PEROL|nr:hypothetical protein FOZ62_004987 [Perkinsus olseni]